MTSTAQMETDHTAFITKNIGLFDRIAPVHGDASTRRYSRVFRGDDSWILCEDAPWTERCDTELVNRLFMNHGIPVPELIATDPAAGLLLMEDGGNTHLQETAGTGSGEAGTTAGIYRQLIDIMLRIQAIQGDGGRPFNRCFDKNKLLFEFEFFIEHGLNGYFQPMPERVHLSAIRSAFAAIADTLDRPADFVLNHRDYHSRNILIQNQNILLIDYQDAMMGLPLYDAVSLLRDSRVVLNARLAAELKEQHRSQLPDIGFRKMSGDEYEHWFRWMAFQRNIKALGTFGYQVSIGNRSFEANIAPVLSYLPDHTEGEPELRKTYDLIKPYLRRE
jgi:aminoglycoside/choline kinase family phosphotransferase